jgi:hypothetical protein
MLFLFGSNPHLPELYLNLKNQVNTSSLTYCFVNFIAASALLMAFVFIFLTAFY